MLLAALLPVLAELTPDPDEIAPAIPGMAHRPSAAPLPGNVPAIYAKTGIEASARQLECIGKYDAGARRPGPLAVRPGSDDHTLAALASIPGLFALADNDTFRLVLSELEARLDEARRLRAIDEAEQWRPVRSRACPSCGCFFLKVLLDAAKRPVGRVECFGHLESGEPCRAVWPRLADMVPDLARADELAG